MNVFSSSCCGCMVALVAFVRLFSSVLHSVAFKSAWCRGCKVTLVTLERLFCYVVETAETVLTEDLKKKHLLT